MFISDKLIYIDLHKTACTHIRKMLSSTIGGELRGKHNRIPDIDRTKFIVGSIRNPWDWYLSLWAYGCKQQGAIFGRTTKKVDMDCYRSGLKREMHLKHLPYKAVIKTVFTDILKPTRQWTHLYSDPENPQLFQQWLHWLYDNRRKYDLGEGYGFCPISNHSGLFTYRYMKLYSDSIVNFYNKDSILATYSGMMEFDRSHNMLNATIRNENLESDLIEAIESAGYKLDETQKQLILNGKSNKTNTSQHHDSSYYHNDETIALITEREKLLVQKYGYTYPKEK